MDITLIVPYYENPGMLRHYYSSLRNLPPDMKDRVHFIVVDDGSPVAPALPEDLLGVSLQIYRIDVDVRWNQDAARNIGVCHSETTWLLLTDIDHMVPMSTWHKLLNSQWDEHIAYKFSRVSAPDMSEYKPHPNSWFLTRRIFDLSGGYDERFAGYYGTDWDFRDRVAEVANEVQRIKAPLVRVPRQVIPDASTTTLLRKQPEDRFHIGRIKAERAKLPVWKPLRFTFPYHRVFPKKG